MNERLNRLIEGRMLSVTDPIVRKVYDEFGWEIFRKCSAPADFSERVIKETFKDINVALEIGTLSGITAAVMTQFAEEVHTLDIVDYAEKYEIWEFLGVTDKIKFHLVEDEIKKKELIDSLSFDIAYSDGNHLNHTYSDFFMVEKCGKVILHEVTGVVSPSHKLVQALPKDEISYFEYGKHKADIAFWSKKSKKGSI